MAQIYIETHGCQMNEADSQDIARRAISAGFTLAERPEDASVLILNTCTVRDNAEPRAYGRIGHWKAVKNADPTVKIIVTGCLAEQDKDRMKKLVPHVDGIFGTRELGALGDALATWRADYPEDDFSVDREIETIMGGARDHAGRPDGQRVQGTRHRRRFRRSPRGGLRARERRAGDVHLVASEGPQREAGARLRDAAEDEP